MKQLILFAFAITCISTYAQENKPAEKKPLTLDVIWGGNYLDEQKLVVRKMNSGDSIAFIRADKATNSQVIVTLDFATGKLIDTIFTNQIRNEKDSSLVTFAFFEDFGDEKQTGHGDGSNGRSSGRRSTDAIFVAGAGLDGAPAAPRGQGAGDRKSTRLNSSH